MKESESERERDNDEGTRVSSAGARLLTRREIMLSIPEVFYFFVAVLFSVDHV